LKIDFYEHLSNIHDLLCYCYHPFYPAEAHYTLVSIAISTLQHYVCDGNGWVSVTSPHTPEDCEDIPFGTWLAGAQHSTELLHILEHLVNVTTNSTTTNN